MRRRGVGGEEAELAREIYMQSETERNRQQERNVERERESAILQKCHITEVS